MIRGDPHLPSLEVAVQYRGEGGGGREMAREECSGIRERYQEGRRMSAKQEHSIEKQGATGKAGTRPREN